MTNPRADLPDRSGESHRPPPTNMLRGATILWALIWNAPVLYLAHDLVASCNRTVDIRGEIERSELVERFFWNWVGINCLMALVGMTTLCVSPRLRRLVRGTDKPFERETMICTFASLILGLFGSLLLRYSPF